MRVLLVDGDRPIRTKMRQALVAMGCRVVEAEAPAAVAAGRFDLIFVAGTDWSARLLAARRRLRVVVLAEELGPRDAIAAIEAGALDVAGRAPTPAEIRLLVEGPPARSQRIAELEAQLGGRALLPPELLLEVERAASSDAAVLLHGEDDARKHLLARAIHDRSRRRPGPFIAARCPERDEDVRACALFGHARGAFAGAVRGHPGTIHEADGGTLLLHGARRMEPALTARLARLVHDHEVVPVGRDRARPVDVRLIVTAGCGLDLLTIAVPPLRALSARPGHRGSRSAGGGAAPTPV